MGINQSTQKINFEDVQYTIKNPETHLLINTLKKILLIISYMNLIKSILNTKMI